MYYPKHLDKSKQQNHRAFFDILHKNPLKSLYIDKVLCDNYKYTALSAGYITYFVGQIATKGAGLNERIRLFDREHLPGPQVPRPNGLVQFGIRQTKAPPRAYLRSGRQRPV
jgi:hypothetical protein